MGNCPKCNDPIAPGETFCGKCGSPLPVQPNAGSANSPGVSTSTGQKNKTWLWVSLVLGVVVVSLLVLWMTGLLGGGAAVSKYIDVAAPDFQIVSDDMDKLDQALTYETSGDAEKDIAELEAELADIDSTLSAVSTAKVDLDSLRVTSPLQKLDTDLKDFYNKLSTDLDYLREIVVYFYTSEKIGTKVAAAAGDSDYADIYEVQEGFRQLKYAIDEGVADLQEVEVPVSLQEFHDSDVEILQQMSNILGDMIKEIEIMDDVGLTASLSQFESLMNQYDTKVAKQYVDILEPEFASLNESLANCQDKKDVIEDELARLKGKFNIESAALNFIP